MRYRRRRGPGCAGRRECRDLPASRGRRCRPLPRRPRSPRSLPRAHGERRLLGNDASQS